jgi:hypothetical protein
VKVVLARQGSYVAGPQNAAEQIREIVDTRSARRDPRAWARAMGAASLYALAALALGVRAVADAQYDPGAAFALVVAIGMFVPTALRVLYRVVTLVRSEAQLPGRRWATGWGSGRVRICARSDRADR